METLKIIKLIKTKVESMMEIVDLDDTSNIPMDIFNKGVTFGNNKVVKELSNFLEVLEETTKTHEKI